MHLSIDITPAILLVLSSTVIAAPLLSSTNAVPGLSIVPSPSRTTDRHFHDWTDYIKSDKPKLQTSNDTSGSNIQPRQQDCELENAKKHCKREYSEELEFGDWVLGNDGEYFWTRDMGLLLKDYDRRMEHVGYPEDRSYAPGEPPEGWPSTRNNKYPAAELAERNKRDWIYNFDEKIMEWEDYDDPVIDIDFAADPPGLPKQSPRPFIFENLHPDTWLKSDIPWLGKPKPKPPVNEEA